MIHSLKNEKNIHFLLVSAFLACVLAVSASLILHKPCWSDECHFIETIRLFITDPTLSTLAIYNEMSPPLPFMLYAVWGRLFGDSLLNLRLLSLIIAVSTYFAFYFLFCKVFSDCRKATWLIVLLALNPYMAGAGVFIYTDMTAMFFLAVLCIAMKSRSPLLSFIGACGGLLCRQYFIFVVVAAFCRHFLNFLSKKQRRDLFIANALFLAVIPLAALFIFWKGFCPSNFFRTVYMTRGMTFHLNSVTVYIIQIIIYLLPVICLKIKSLYGNRKRLIAAALTCWIYWLIPVAVSPAARGKTTIGLFHRLLRFWPGETYEQWVFFICFALALPVLFSIFSDAWQRIKSHDNSYPLFIDLSTIAFFVVMPFSYLHWEKYFLPLFPIVAMQLLLSNSKPARSDVHARNIG
jgi:4-amino-4-deoxy-L-arabinose transferase-like glycosyltransferase